MKTAGTKLKLTVKEIDKAINETIEGFGPKYYEACHLFKEGMKKAIDIVNKRRRKDEK